MLAINRPYLINKFLQGQAMIANGPILPNSWAYHDGLEQFRYDPEEAINLLKAEGYASRPMEARSGRKREPHSPLH